MILLANSLRLPVRSFRWARLRVVNHLSTPPTRTAGLGKVTFAQLWGGLQIALDVVEPQLVRSSSFQIGSRRDLLATRQRTDECK
jgi:hypothetical protein